MCFTNSLQGKIGTLRYFGDTLRIVPIIILIPLLRGLGGGIGHPRSSKSVLQCRIGSSNTNSNVTYKCRVVKVSGAALTTVIGMTIVISIRLIVKFHANTHKILNATSPRTTQHASYIAEELLILKSPLVSTSVTYPVTAFVIVQKTISLQ